MTKPVTTLRPRGLALGLVLGIFLWACILLPIIIVWNTLR